MSKNIIFIFLFNCILLSTTENLFLKDKNPIEQIIIIEKYIEKDKKNLDLYILKAQIELNIRDFLGAEDTLLKAYKINSKNIKVLNLLGLTYFLLKNYEKAKDFFYLTLEIDRNNDIALNYLSILDPFNKKLPIEKKLENEIRLSKEELLELIKQFEEIEIDNTEEMVYLLYEKETELLDDGTMNYTIYCVVKIISNSAVSYFRDFFLSYNSFEFKPEVIYAGTYDYELNFKSVNFKNIVFTDKKDDKYTMYTNRKYVAFPFPDVKKGSIVEYKIRFNSTNKKLTPNISDSYIFSSGIRILNSNYIIKYPKNLTINIFNTNNEKIVKQIIESESNITIKYSYKNPPIIRKDEVNNSNLNIYDISDKVIFTTFKDWQEISSWYYKIFEDAMSKSDVSKEVFKIINLENKNKLEQIEEIYKFIQKNINYVAIELEEGAFVPHHPEEIFKNKFGDCKDQSLLLIHILRKRGIIAYPVLISTRDNGLIIKDIPSPFYFNHLITYIPEQNGIKEGLFLDTTSKFIPFYNLPSIIQGVQAFIIKNSKEYEFKNTPIISYEKNRLEEYYIAKVNIIGAGELEYIEKFNGAYSEIIRNTLEGKENEQVIKDFYEIQKKSFLDLKKEDIKINGLENQSGEIELNIKTYERNITNIFYDGKQKIKYSIGNLTSFYNIPERSEFNYTKDFLFSYKKVIEYILPSDYEIINSTFKNIKRENKYISFEFYAEKKGDNHIILIFESYLKKREIQKDDLKFVNEFLQKASNELNFEITFENKKSFDFDYFYSELIKVYNQKVVYENYINKLLELKKKDKALEIANKSIELFSDYSFFYVIMASILLEKKEIKNAEAILLKGLINTNYDFSIYVSLIDLYKKSNNNIELEKILLEFLKKFPNNSSIVFELTAFYNRVGEYDKSIQILEEMIKKNPDNSSYFSELGYVYSLKQDFKNAEDNFKKSLELNSDNANALNNLAWLYCENNVKIEQAIELALKACEIDQFNDLYLDTLAEAYFLNEEYEKAIEAIKKAIKINPNYTYLQQQLEKIEKAKKKIEEKNKSNP